MSIEWIGAREKEFRDLAEEAASAKRGITDLDRIRILAGISEMAMIQTRHALQLLSDRISALEVEAKQ